MKKSLKKQAVFPVLMLLVVTALALIGSSFAWFSMASIASVTQVTGQVEDAGIGLMISQDASSFTSNVTLSSDASTYVVPTKFHQVSTVNGVTFYDATILAKNDQGVATSIQTVLNNTVQDTNGVAKGASALGNSPVYDAASGAASLASYMVFDLFFQTENAGSLYLDYQTAFTGSKNSDKAMRVAFLAYSPQTTGATAIAQTSVSSTTIWEPKSTETNSAKVLTYGVKAADTFAPYSEVSNKTELQTTYIDGQLFDTSAWGDGHMPGDGIRSIATLAANQITKVRVVVWLEGNDPDCVASVAQGNLTLDLHFFAKANPSS